MQTTIGQITETNMNIFYLNHCPRRAAEEQCDQHIVKMPLETAQILSTAHRVVDGTMVILSRAALSQAVKLNAGC